MKIKYILKAVIAILVSTFVPTVLKANILQKTPPHDQENLTLKAEGLSAQTSFTNEVNPRAFRDIYFGEKPDSVQTKLKKILNSDTEIDNILYLYSPNFWRFLFDNVEEFESYQIHLSNTQSKDFLNLKEYFGRNKTIEIHTVSGSNDALNVRCFFLTPKNEGISASSLGIMEVKYIDIEEDKLVEAFLRNHSSAKKFVRKISIPSDKHPGISLVFERVFYIQSTESTEVWLSIPTRNFDFTFPEIDSLSDEAQATWRSLRDRENERESLSEYYDSTKAKILAARMQVLDQTKVKNISRPLDALTYLGWYGHNKNQDLIFSNAEYVSKSRTIIKAYMTDFREYLKQLDIKERREEKERNESALNF